MNVAKTSIGAEEGADPAGLHASADQGRDAERLRRISSLKPQIAVVLATIISATFFGASAQQMFVFNRVPWILLTLGGGHALVALAGFALWKRVDAATEHYVVSDFTKSERISFEDVCMVVRGQGLIWKSVRIHFRRPTRFGWSVSYVPVSPIKISLTMAANSDVSARQPGLRR